MCETGWVVDANEEWLMISYYVVQCIASLLRPSFLFTATTKLSS